MSVLEGCRLLSLLQQQDKVKADILDLIALDGDEFTDGEIIDYIHEYLTVEESQWGTGLKFLINEFQN